MNQLSTQEVQITSYDLPGKISIEFRDTPFENIERYRGIIEILLRQRVFDIRSSQVILHFDHQGILQEIEFARIKIWRREKKNEGFNHGR